MSTVASLLLIRKDKTMTEEEIKALQDRNAELEKENNDLRLENDSLKEENQKLIETDKSINEELAETKKLNFTLARRTSAEVKSAEEIINEMF